MSLPGDAIAAAECLRDAAQRLSFGGPVVHVYNPLHYAWPAHRRYLEHYARGRKRCLFVGMNPGPFGMAQTGVPFGEVSLVRDWLGVQAGVGKPPGEHPKRPVDGFACRRSEVSGLRLWGLFRERFGTAGAFFREHFVANYCPLLFIEESGRNRTPDKLPAAEAGPLLGICDAHLAALARALRPDVVVGVGKYAEARARTVLGDTGVGITTVLHPSPASPLANRDWPGTATRQLVEAGVWEEAGVR